MILKSKEKDFDEIYEIINDAAQAYRGIRACLRIRF
jgi:hypothetical protein